MGSHDLSMLASLLRTTQNSQTMEYLMATMWILLRHESNRALLSKSLKTGPVDTRHAPPVFPDGYNCCYPSPNVFYFMVSPALLAKCRVVQLQDTIDVHDVHTSLMERRSISGLTGAFLMAALYVRFWLSDPSI